MFCNCIFPLYHLGFTTFAKRKEKVRNAIVVILMSQIMDSVSIAKLCFVGMERPGYMRAYRPDKDLNSVCIVGCSVIETGPLFTKAILPFEPKKFFSFQ